MPDLLHRPCPDLEVRTAGDGRTVFGLLVPYGRTTEVDDGFGRYSERIILGAFARTIRERGDRVKMLVSHERRAIPVGKFTLLREDPAGLYGEGRFGTHEAAEQALTAVREGLLDSFSVGFKGLRDRRADDGAVERTECALYECSLTAFPAYEDALVAGVRSDFDPTTDRERWRHRLSLLKD